MKKAIYPGSFDPLTNGHLDIIERASKLFDNLIIAIIKSSNKDFLFTEHERKEMIECSIKHLDNVKIKIFDGLLIDFTKKENAEIIIRGLRVLSDFEYEFKMALMNRNLDDKIVTLFMMPHERYTHVTSSLIREVSSLKGDISSYVPSFVDRALKETFEKK